MSIKIALAGNPNCGKTTLFNELTGNNQYVGNWPGVTVEKKEGELKGNPDVIIQDLPGIYSLSPYTLEEVVTRNYLVNDKPDAILNIVDGTNLERNLYLTTQLVNVGPPMVIAVNMADVLERLGDKVDLQKLGERLRCPVIDISALKGRNCVEAASMAIKLAAQGRKMEPPHVFTGSVEHALAHIEESLPESVPTASARWFAIKVFEHDKPILEKLAIAPKVLEHMNEHVADCEKEMGDDAESIITSQRYEFINKLISEVLTRNPRRGSLSASDKIDKVVTNRILALPIFVLIMFFVYWLSMGPFGSFITDWTNDTFGGDWMGGGAQWLMDKIGVAGWLSGLVVDGIVGGVGAVLGFVPQMFVLFLMLSILEDVGYMARIAFIMDRLFRKFGLSGKSFIPMLISSGCGVPGVMASRTIENDRDRKMTIMTTTFVPCGAKMPIVGLVAAALFNGAGWIATIAYFTGVAAIVFSGIILKKTKMFSGDPAPFVMELPAYHIPFWKNIFHGTWERGWSFVKRAGTIIVLASIIIWFTSGYGWAPAEVEEPAAKDIVSVDADVSKTQDESPIVFRAVEDMDASLLGKIGSVVSPVFAPLGFGNWQSTVATVMGLVAKEEVVGVFGVLYGVDNDSVAAADIVDDEEMSEHEKAEALSPIMKAFDETSGGYAKLGAFCFLIFNLLCAPCFAAIGAIRREMNNAKWTWFAIGYQCGLAYVASLIVFQLGVFFNGAGFTFGTAVAIALFAAMTYLLFRRNRFTDDVCTVSVTEEKK